MTEQVLYSVVVPVYKSAETLEELCERITKTFSEIEGDHELIFVEDGGCDSCWQVLQTLHQRNPRVKIIRLSRNFGQHNALMCGFSFARGDFVITLDDDLQNPPEEIPKLIAAIHSSDADVVFGIPASRKHSLFRNAGSYLFQRLLRKMFKQHPSLEVSNVQIIRRATIQSILRIQSPNPLVALLLLEATDRIQTVTIEHHPRPKGKTTYTGSRLLESFAHGILYHSALPLKGVFLMGMGCFCLSFLLGIVYLGLFLSGLMTVPGWTTLVLIILFFSGIVMISLGIIGEYLFRIIQEVRHTPSYIIRDKEL